MRNLHRPHVAAQEKEKEKDSRRERGWAGFPGGAAGRFR